MRPLLIVGLDPGTTVGYAMLDLDGRVVSIGSSKLVDFNALIKIASDVGLPLVAATDKRVPPGMVEKFAAKTGSRLMHPPEDMLVEDKRRLVQGMDYGNDHERDALSCAIYAHKQLKPLLEKIGHYVDRNRKQGIKSRITRLVVLNDMSIATAVEMIERPDREDTKVLIAAVEKKAYSREYDLLYGRLSSLKTENAVLLEKNALLKKDFEVALQKIRYLETRSPTPAKAVRMKELAVRSLAAKLGSLERLLMDEKRRSRDLRRFIFLARKNILVKRCSNLGNAEIMELQRISGVAAGDMLLVDNPSIAGKEALSFLQGVVEIVITERDAAPLRQFTVLRLSSLAKVAEVDGLVLFTPESVSAEIKKKGLIDRLVTEYRETRS